MRRTPSLASILSIALGVALVFSPQLAAQGNPAGQVSRVIPAVAIQRSGQLLTATATMPVIWNDTVVTQKLARARIDLNDGSVLNVGSDTSLKITKHDPTSQQTEMDLNYGRLRSHAVHLAKPKANFEVHSPVGTAGVVGTDFYLAFENLILRLIVFEGAVRFCNLAGVCVTVGQGQMSSIRNGNQSPDPPVAVPNADLAEAVASTDIGTVGTAQGPPPHHSPWFYVGIATIAILPAAVLVPTLTTRTGVPNCQKNPKAFGC